jgi:hypothetical protein
MNILGLALPTCVSDDTNLGATFTAKWEPQIRVQEVPVPEKGLVFAGAMCARKGHCIAVQDQRRESGPVSNRGRQPYADNDPDCVGRKPSLPSTESSQPKAMIRLTQQHCSVFRSSTYLVRAATARLNIGSSNSILPLSIRAFGRNEVRPVFYSMIPQVVALQGIAATQLPFGTMRDRQVDDSTPATLEFAARWAELPRLRLGRSRRLSRPSHSVRRALWKPLR